VARHRPHGWLGGSLLKVGGNLAITADGPDFRFWCAASPSSSSRCSAAIVRKAKAVASVVVRSRPVSPLRQRMIEDMQRRNFSPRTIAAYVGAIGRFSRHFNNKGPTKIGATEIRTWQLILHDRGLSFSTNTASCALRFLYCVVLGMPDMTTMNHFRANRAQAADHSLARRSLRAGARRQL